MTEPKDPATPKVFLSYSWTSPEHETRVSEFATRLAGDGIDVVFDKWSLSPGQDTHTFMELMVHDSTINHVLILCDRAYRDKADARKAGVGKESQIISSEVYESVDQKKFIPIVFEKEDDGSAILPTYLKSRFYLDFSNPGAADTNYEKLIRLLYGQPKDIKPSLGKPPHYISAGSTLTIPTRPRLVAFIEAVECGRTDHTGFARDYLSTLFEGLSEFRIVGIPAGEHIDNIVYSKIRELLPYRNEFIEFATKQLRYRNDTETIEVIAEFFEHSLSYKYSAPNQSPWHDTWADHFDYFLYELFLYFIALVIKYRKYDKFPYLLDRPYLLPAHIRESGSDFASFGVFRAYCESFKQRNSRLKLNQVDLMAGTIREHCTQPDLSFQSLIEAELFLFLKSTIQDANLWYPRTVLFAPYYPKFELFLRCQSKREFALIRPALGIASKAELVERLKAGSAKHRIAQWPVFHHRPLGDEFTLINLPKLDTEP